MDLTSEQFNRYLELQDIHVTIKYLGDSKNHLWHDTYERPKYKCTVKTPSGQYTFTFWDTIASKQLNDTSNKIHLPDNITVLQCVTSMPVYSKNPDDYLSFKDFCDYYGYDEYSHAGKLTYKYCLKEWKNVCRIFTEEQVSMINDVF